MTNILVTGSNGQLGSELRKFFQVSSEYTWFFTDVDQLDITDRSAVNNYFKENSINVCVNCAAYTAVDKAEDEPEKAKLLNAFAVGLLADACYSSDALLIHISTDYVFNGRHYKPYDEDDQPDPVSAYGKSKAEGEKVLFQHKARSVIIRTSWLYSSVGNNFVKTMLRLGRERSEIKVVSDQIGTPTWAADLAEAIVFFIHNHHKQQSVKIYHYSNEGVISWYDFAIAIMHIEGLQCKVIPIESKDYPVKTERPFYSVLNKSRIKLDTGITIPYWLESLKSCLRELKESTK